MSRVRRRSQGLRWQLEQFERQLLQRLCGELAAALDGPPPEGQPGQQSVDPVRARLFPSAVIGDQTADAELRRLIHDDLLGVKRAGIDALAELLSNAEVRGERARLDLTVEDAHLALGVLNDLRLAIGARIDIERIDREAIGDHAPEAGPLAVMDHLAWMQEQLLSVLDPASVSVYDDPDVREGLLGRDDEPPDDQQ